MSFDCDVIVIGAGFAGLTAARELSHRRLSTVILEGRDRIGGRTKTVTLSSGEIIDVGGTHVHWIQPHVWAEITRYGLEGSLADAATPIEHIAAPTAHGLKWYSPTEHHAREKRLFDLFFEPSSRLFPKPYLPLLRKEELKKWDISLADRLAQLPLSDDDVAFFTPLLATFAADDIKEGGYLALMRWYALGGHDYDKMSATLLGNKFLRGTLELATAILKDSSAELRLNTPVRELATTAGGVRVTVGDGSVVTSRACVVATPSGAWADLKFSPPLSENRIRVAREHGLQALRGANVRLKLKGEKRRFCVYGELGHPIGMLYTKTQDSDEIQWAALFPSPAMKDAADRAEVEAAVKDVLPHVEVLEMTAATFYTEDPFSRGGPPLAKPGVLTRDEPPIALAKPEGRIFFATADIAHLWNSFIDGAIETGLRAGRMVSELLRPG